MMNPVILAFASYFVIGALLSCAILYLRIVIVKSYDSEGEVWLAFVTFLFWPISIPIMGLMSVLYKTAEAFRDRARKNEDRK